MNSFLTANSMFDASMNAHVESLENVRLSLPDLKKRKKKSKRERKKWQFKTNFHISSSKISPS